MSGSAYASTAYNSASPRTPAGIDNARLGYGTRMARRNPLNTHGYYCGEYLAVDVVGLAAEECAEKTGDFTASWQSEKGVFFAIKYFAALGALIAVGSCLSMLLLLFTSLFEETFKFYLSLAIASVFCSWILFRYLASPSVRKKNTVVLNRFRGMIAIPRLRGPAREIPFDEFDPYLLTTTNPTGSTNYFLHIGHRFSKAFFQYPVSFSDPWKAHQLWEFWQQYMDISKPLPDTPTMESFRSRDPFTAEHDLKSGRLENFWKNLDLETAQRMQEVSIQAAREFPWGATREDALAMGWRPSGYGEGPSSDRSTPPRELTPVFIREEMEGKEKEIRRKEKAEIDRTTWAIAEKRGDFEEM